MFILNISLKTRIASLSWPAWQRQHTHGKKDLKHSSEAKKKKTETLLRLLNTSMRNLGLSGRIRLKKTAEVRLGTEHSTTNTLQLWKSSDPKDKCAQVRGITSQARPADRNAHTHKGRRKQRELYTVFTLYVSIMHGFSEQLHTFFHGNSFCKIIFYPASLSRSLLVCSPTCCQDVTSHPEGGQGADHCSSPHPRHEFWEVGEDDRNRPSNPREVSKTVFTSIEMIVLLIKRRET